MQTGNRHEDESGFLMVALLVGMAVAAVYMSAALPAWRQQAQREKEQDLIFRGRQYARAIALYQDKNRGANPPDIDILVSQHFLRKKWKDPVTGEDFVPLGVGIATPGSGSQTGTIGGQSGQSGGGQPLANQNPGVSGVRSKSTATSIKIYQNQQQYSLWPFNAASYRAETGRSVPQQPGQPPRGGPGAGGPGGGPGGAPGSGVQPPRGGGGPGGPGGAAGSGPPPPPRGPGGAAGS